MTQSIARVVVIVPAWNEASGIADTIQEIRDCGQKYDVVVVDDGSDDETATIAARVGATVLSLPFNLGVGGAMRTGFTYAARHGYDAAIQVDADGQHNPTDIPRVLAGLEHANISIGARFADKGDYTVTGPRKWAMTLLAAAISRIAKTRLTDVTSGFRAADARAIDQYLHYYPSEYLGDTLDSLVAAVYAGLTVTQVPVAMRPRAHGTPSQGPLSSTVYLLRSILALGLAVLRRGGFRSRGAIA